LPRFMQSLRLLQRHLRRSKVISVSTRLMTMQVTIGK
jgi:hypothetical protein